MYKDLRLSIERKIPLTDEEWNFVVEKVKFIKLKKNGTLQFIFDSWELLTYNNNQQCATETMMISESYNQDLIM